MKQLQRILAGLLLTSVASYAGASSVEDHVIELDCPNLMKGTMHINDRWDDGYLTAKGVGTLTLKSHEQIDTQGAIYIFSNGEVTAKILPMVKNNVVNFYLWDKGDWRACTYQ